MNRIPRIPYGHRLLDPPSLYFSIRGSLSKRLIILLIMSRFPSRSCLRESPFSPLAGSLKRHYSTKARNSREFFSHKNPPSIPTRRKRLESIQCSIIAWILQKNGSFFQRRDNDVHRVVWTLKGSRELRLFVSIIILTESLSSWEKNSIWNW